MSNRQPIAVFHVYLGFYCDWIACDCEEPQDVDAQVRFSRRGKTPDCFYIEWLDTTNPRTTNEGDGHGSN